MTLVVTSVELWKESRRIAVDNENISQTVSFALQGNFIDEAEVTTDLWLMNDDHQVMQAVYDIFPWYREFKIQTGEVIILIVSDFDLEQVNDTTWKITLTYDLPEGPNSNLNQDAVNTIIETNNFGPGAGENNGDNWSEEFTQLSFDTTAEQQHINVSRRLNALDLRTDLPAGITAPSDAVGKPCPIGVHKDEIDGADIYRRAFKFNITQYFSPQKLKYAYVRRLYRLTGCLNNATFFGFPKGSVLFLGASANGSLVRNVPVTFEFAVQPNFKFITTATVLSDPNTDDVNLMYDQLADAWFPATSSNQGLPGGAGVHSGWSIVDYRYLPVPDDDAKMIIQKPSFRYIHQPYEYGDFNKLQL